MNLSSLLFRNFRTKLLALAIAMGMLLALTRRGARLQLPARLEWRV